MIYGFENLFPPSFFSRIHDLTLLNIDNNQVIDEHQDKSDINQDIDINSKSFEYFLSIPKITNSEKENQPKRKKRISIYDYIRRNINNLKEDLVYYFSSTESLRRFKSSLKGEIKYDFYNNLIYENFIAAQKERSKLILSNINSNPIPKVKVSKLSKFYDSFSPKLNVEFNTSQRKTKLIYANLIGVKINECPILYSNQEINENEIISYLYELKDIFASKTIDMESIGLILFNSIENNFISILKLIEYKLVAKKNSKCLTNLCLLCIDIFQYYKSTKLYFYVLQLIKQNEKMLDYSQLKVIKIQMQFIPNNFFNFGLLNENIKKVLIKDFKQPLTDKCVIKFGYNFINLEVNDYITLNYDNYLFLFFNSEKNLKENNGYYIYYYKIDLISTKIINVGKIKLKDKEKCNYDVFTEKINISLKDELIYIIYIIQNKSKFCLQYKLYSKYSISLVKEGEIELKEKFFPFSLFNDNKYIYCISLTNEILIIKRNKKLDHQKYIICSFRLFENDLINYQTINTLLDFQMYNSLFINDIVFLQNDKRKYIAKFIINKNDEYILNIYSTFEKEEINKSIKIAYSDKRFIITKIEGDNILYDMTSNDFNHLIDKGILLLPFHSHISIHNNPDNLYEYLIKEYSSFLNLFGNFELINAEKEQNLIKYPFSLCCNFDKNILNFVIDNIISNSTNNYIKLYYIIILKKNICALYNVEILEEKMIQKIIPYFKKLIVDIIKSKEKKLLNKILFEIIEISSYIKNDTTIEIDDIKFALETNYMDINIKSKFLIIELLLQQYDTKNIKELYKCIIHVDQYYLVNMLKNDSFSISHYSLYTKIMNNASESLYKRANRIKEELIYYTPNLLENVKILVELYKTQINNKNNHLEEFSLLYHSFNFRALFFIIEYLIANKIYLRKQEYILQIYRTLLIMDKKELNYNEIFDMNNIIEITNNSFLDDNKENIHDYNFKDTLENVIKFKDKTDLIIRTNLLLKEEYEELENSIKININSSKNNKRVKYTQDKDIIYQEVSEMKVEFNTRNINKNKSDFIINIIPIKNKKLFESYINNKDHKIISLIEKSCIYYLLFLFEDIYSLIEQYNNDKIVKSYKKLFQSEIFKSLSIPMKEQALNNNISTSQFNEITNQLLEKLDKTINIQNFNSLTNDLITNFNKENKEILNFFPFLKVYEDRRREISSDKEKCINLFNGKKYDIYDKLLQIFNHDLSKKKLIAQQIVKNSNLNSLINKIFFFAVKYYNYFEKLDLLMKEIEKMNIVGIYDTKKNINQIQNLENYSLFYSFYEESFKVKDIYQKYKNEFKNSNFEEENKKYFENNLMKIDFLYKSLVPNNDKIIKPNTQIIKDLIELIDNNIGITEIIQYSKIHNIIVDSKIIEIIIINNLLLHLNNEFNMSLILNLINKKKSNSNNISYSLFDDIDVADFYKVEQLINQFNLFLNILSFKTTNPIYHFSIIIHNSLTESLIWKINRRNFHILLEIMEIFKIIKERKKISKNNKLFLDNNNIKFINLDKNIECKFEVFKIMVNQIINIIKDILKDTKENGFKKLFKKIMSFFIDIEPFCFYYDDLILFFYKILNGSDILLKYILNEQLKVVEKIIKISFNLYTEIRYKDKNINTRLIMIKLLCQIIENLEEKNLKDLFEIFKKLEKQDIINQNPLIYLYEKLLKELIEITNKSEIMIHKYYKNLLIICCNKIFELEQNNKSFEKIINNKYLLYMLLFSNYYLLTSESQFVLKSNKDNNFENIAIFNSENNQEIKCGKIICFVGDDFNINSYLNQFYSDKKKSNSPFNKSILFYNSRNSFGEFKTALILMKDFEQLDFYNISNIEIKNISELEKTNTENKYLTKFLHNNSKSIKNLIKDELYKDIYDDKGIYLILKILTELLKYLDKDDIFSIFEYFWKFYNIIKSEENYYPFMSFEYIEKIMNKYYNLKNIKNIYKEKEDTNKSLFSTFNIIIKNNTLQITRKNEFQRNNFLANLTNPIKYDNQYLKKIYSQSYKLANILFDIPGYDNLNIFISNNSIMFKESIVKYDDIIDISDMIEKNTKKIEVIILSNIDKNINQSILRNFINEFGIPIYTIEKEIFKQLFDFFIKGKGVNHIYPYKYNKLSFNEYNIFSIVSLNLEKKTEDKYFNTKANLDEIKPTNKAEKKDKPKHEPLMYPQYYDSNKNYSDIINFDLAFGFDKKNKNEKLKDDIIIFEKKYIKEYETNRNEIFNDLKNELKNMFNIINIKLSKRLILDILYLDLIKLSDMESLYKDIKIISDIYDSLCLEYYFNCEYKIYNAPLKEKLINIFKKLSDENEIISNNKWILYHFKQISSIKNNKNIFKLTNLNLTNLNTEKKLLDKYKECPNIIYDKLFIISEILTKNNNNEYFINNYYDIMNILLSDIILKLNNYQNESEGNYDYLMLLKIITIIYNHYLNKNNNAKMMQKSLIPINIEENVKKIMYINLDDYFPNQKVTWEDLFVTNKKRKTMTKQTAFIIEFLFKYFDLCLILFSKENQNLFFNYMISLENHLFKYYRNYKILTMKKSNENNDYKITAAFIYYIIEIMSSKYLKINQNKINNKAIFEMTVDLMNEYKFNNKSEFHDILFSKIEDYKYDIFVYNKIIIYSLDKDNKKYYLQDIIDLKDIDIYNNTYKLRVKNNKMYLSVLDSINTYLYSIENTTEESNLKIINQTNSLNKYTEIPKYSWNIGDDGNNYLLLSEEDYNVYNFFEDDNNKNSINGKFNLNKKIEVFNTNGNKILGFLHENKNRPFLVYTEKGDIYIFDENKDKYKWLINEYNKNQLFYLISIKDVKIANISINCNGYYAIGKDGNLYESKEKTILKIPPPNLSKKFLQCVCGDNYLICLVQNYEEKGCIYVKGFNNDYQCGINYKDKSDELKLEYIPQLTKIEINNDLDFKFICTYEGFSAAITTCGKLYIWGIFKKNKKPFIMKSPLLINKYESDSIIIDKIALNHDCLYAIGRKLENGNYIKKLFSLEVTDEIFPFVLKEIDIIDKEGNNSRMIPVQILIGEKKTFFLCVNENEILNEIMEDEQKNYFFNNKIKILINENKQSPNVVAHITNFNKIYNSNELNKFIDLFNSFSEKNLKLLIKSLEKIKKEDIQTEDIYYNELITFLKDKPEFDDLLLFFLNCGNNEGKILFDYLKTRISLIEKDIIHFININNSIKTDKFFQKIIEKNIIYLNEDFRIQYFYSILLNMEYRFIKKDITIDRLNKALTFKEKFNENKIPDIHLSETIFGQLFHSLGDLSGNEFLREKGAKMFRVKLKDERAIDVGGPYSEILSDICDDLQSDYVDLFIKTPNNKYDNGELRDRYIINPNCNNINHKKAFEFIGKLMILAISSGETLNLNLHPIIWKSLLENQITFKEYETIDYYFYNTIEKVKEGFYKKDKNLIDSLDLNFVIKNSNEKDIELIKNGQDIKVTLENVEKFIDLAQSMRLNEINEQIKCIKDGLYSAIGKIILQLLNWKQLEEMVCGEAKFDIVDFKKHTKYANCNSNDEIIKWFWEWLENCKEEYKFKYLKLFQVEVDYQNQIILIL